MRLKMDKHGRVLLPMDLRLRYGLHPGIELEVGESAKEFALRPVRSSDSMVNDNGIWVHLGVPSRRLDFAKTIRESRERS